MPIGAAITAVGAIGGAVISGNASKDAAKAQAAATQAGIDQSTKTQLGMFEKGENYLKPYATLGTEALPTLKSLLGLGTEGADGMMSMLEKYPGYQFALGEGQKAINNQQIAGGAKYSGNALKAAADYNRNMGAGLFSDYYNKLLGIASGGASASGNIAALAGNTGANVGKVQYEGNQSIGASKAAGIMGQAGAWTNAIDQMTGAFNKLPISGQSFGSLGGGGGAIGAGEMEGINALSAAAMSDRDMKREIMPADDDALLAALLEIPVFSYRYIPGAWGDRQIGPMAQDWAVQFGGDGKTIPMPQIIGALLGALRALAARVDRAEAVAQGAL